MGGGAILRVSWLCLLLLGDSLAFPLMKGDRYPSKSGQLETSPTEMLGAYDQATAHADSYKSYKTPLAAAPKRPLLSPNDGTGNQGGGAVEFGTEDSKMKDWDVTKPVTFPLNPNYHFDGEYEQSGSKGPDFTSAVSYEPSTTQSLKPGSSVFPSSELPFDPIPPHQSFNFDDSSPITQTFAAEPVYSSGGDFDPSQNPYLQDGVKDGSQGTSPNLVYDIPYPSAEEADNPFKGGDSSDYYSVDPVQPSTWFSASYVTKEEPVFTSESGYWDQAAPTSNGMQTLEAEESSSGGKGGDFSYSQNFNFQAGDDGPSHDLVYEEVFQYPAAETEEPPSKGGDSSYDYAATWSSASYITREEEPVFNNLAYGAEAAPVESPASPSYLTVDSTSSKVSAAPVRHRPVRKVPAQRPSTQQLEAPREVSEPFPSTFIVQSKGGYSRGRKVSSKTRYYSGYPPPPPFVHEALRRASDNQRKG